MSWTWAILIMKGFTIYIGKGILVIRAKTNMACIMLYSRPVDKNCGLRCDQPIRLAGFYTRGDYPDLMSRIKYFNDETGSTYVF